jgi:hypothetical protein
MYEHADLHAHIHQHFHRHPDPHLLPDIVAHLFVHGIVYDDAVSDGDNVMDGDLLIYGDGFDDAYGVPHRKFFAYDSGVADADLHRYGYAYADLHGHAGADDIGRHPSQQLRTAAGGHGVGYDHVDRVWHGHGGFDLERAATGDVVRFSGK